MLQNKQKEQNSDEVERIIEHKLKTEITKNNTIKFIRRKNLELVI